MLSDLIEVLGIMSVVFGATWFIILPVAFHYIFRSLWGRYIFIQNVYVNQSYVLLELIPPRDVEKSPKIMESFFDVLTGTDKGANILEEYCDGYVNPYFSFEIVGAEGVAHFYVRTPVFFRDLVESALYAQYPDVEIVEVDDYVKQVPQVIPNKEWSMWGVDMVLEKDDAYPIKTYKYFQEDVTGKMIDPLAGLMEVIGTLGPGQHIWLQYIVQAERPHWYFNVGKKVVDKFLGRNQEDKPSMFAGIWRDLRDVIMGVFTGWAKAVEFTPASEVQGKDEQPVEFRLTPGEKQVLTALEENISKGMFRTKMRLIVLGRKEGFSKATIGSTMGAIKQLNHNHLNSFMPDDQSKTYANFFLRDHRTALRSRRILDRYRDRDDSNSAACFHMSTEEMATVFHLPDMSVTSPSVMFVDSRRGSAPSNLPFQ